MDFVAAPDHFAHEVDGLRRTAAGGRVEGFVREKRDAQGTWHGETLGIPAGWFNQISGENVLTLGVEKLD
jgi:hypothetical protein